VAHRAIPTRRASEGSPENPRWRVGLVWNPALRECALREGEAL
jgi:hypothetical protein